MMLHIVFVLCCVCLLWKFICRNRGMEPPLLSGIVPLIGHVYWLYGDSKAFYNNMVVKLSKISLEKGGVLKGFLGPLSFYFVSDPEDCLTIANVCLEKHYIYNFMKPLLENGLLVADVPTWMKHRKLLKPAFSQHVLNGFIDIFNTKAQKLVDQFDKQLGKEFNHEPVIRIISLEIICATAIGVQTEHLVNVQNQYLHQLENALRLVNQRVQQFWLHPDFTYNMSSLKAKAENAWGPLKELTNLILLQKQNELKNKDCNGRTTKKTRPFMDLILELTEDNSCMKKEHVRGETNGIIVAGHDTNASTLTFALTLLGSHPQVQKKAYEEILQVFGNSHSNVDKESLAKLVYIEAILKESLRLYPIAPVIIRQLDKDVKLKNCTLKANTGCMLSIHGMNRHGIWGPDADTFRPERWFEKETLPDLKYYTPFGIGRRACIGKVYAMILMKIVIAKVLQQYIIRSDIKKMVIKLDTMIRPSSGHFITLNRRHK